MDAEREILGICHADIAALVNERWHLPAEIADVMVNHHNDIDISNEHAKMLAVVKLADVLARGLQFGYACDNTVPVIENKVFSLLDITPKKLDAILTASHEALQNSMDYISED
jgi:HD-like signal output (HDOD) protein